MRELSLFTGIGGGLLGSHLLGWTPIGYVEWNEYCQRVIAQRIKDGILPVAPIFTDVREFVQSGAAEQYRGVTDVVSAGFPCTPFSIAGRQRGADDENNMWPATIATIRLVRPHYCLLENVPGLVTSGYFGTILGELSEIGYDCRWCVLSASHFVDQKDGKRLWIVATSNGKRLEGIHQSGRGKYSEPVEGTIPRHVRRATPRVYRRSDGHAKPVERIRAVGNAQVAGMAATAWRLLTGDIGK